MCTDVIGFLAKWSIIRNDRWDQPSGALTKQESGTCHYL